MKSKLKALLGIGLTLVLLASLMVGLVVPAGAAPAKLKFSTLALPKVGEDGNYWAYPSSDVGPIAVSPDGDTLFAAVETDPTSWEVMKSTDGGYAWKVLRDFCTVAEAAEDPSTPIVVDVVVSPDYEEDPIVIVATEKFVYQSVDGGVNFFKMNEAWGNQTITDLDVALDGRGHLAIMVGTKDVVSVPLEASDNATAEWSTDPAKVGSYSAKLTDGSGAYQEAAVLVPYGKALSTVTDALAAGKFLYWIYPETTVHLCAVLYVDTDEDGDTDVILHSTNIGLDATKLDTWQGVTPTNNWAAKNVDATNATYPGCGAWWDGSGYTEETAGTALYQALASWTNGVGQDDKVLYVGAATVGCGGGTFYIDDITIGDDPYELEAPADVYVLSTKTGMTWQPQGVSTSDVLACAFSPFFADDEGISAVVTDTTTTRVRFAFAYTATGGGWGDNIGDASVKSAQGDEFASDDACIGFPDDFDAFGIDNNICFVGIDATKDGDMLGDVYKVKLGGVSSATDLDVRGMATSVLPTETNIFSIDVCGDAEDANILVGTGYLKRVYRSTDGGESWSKAGKSPTGGIAQVLMSPDFLTSGIAYAATWGDGSAFSRTTDSGNSWDQISLIDYANTDPGYTVTSLVAGDYNETGTIYLVTQLGTSSLTDGAVWKKAGKHWERIYYAANNISQVIVNGDDSMFAVDYVKGKIYRSSNMGATWPKTITTKTNLTAVAIVKPTFLYTGHADGGLYCSTKSGVAWTPPKESDVDNKVMSISVKGEEVVLVSTEDGGVFISSDGGETVKSVGADTPGKFASFDVNFTDNGIIYAAGADGEGVWRAEVDLDNPRDAEWEPFLSDVTCSSPAITLPPSGILYVSDADEVAPAAADGSTPATGGLWRSVNPTAPAPYVSFEQVTKGLSAEEPADCIGLASFDISPTVLFFKNSAAATPTDYYKQVLVYSDTLDCPVTLASPADGAAGVGDLYAGQFKVDAAVTWAKMSGATSYQYQVSIDKAFNSVIDSGFTAGQIAPLALSPNKTYYWRVRVAKDVSATTTPKAGGAPLYTPWSAAWSFRTAIGATAARPALEAPDAGASDVLLSPTFEWSGIAWAETYEFELGLDPATTAGGYFATPLVALTGTNALVSTAWKCDKALEYETRYYWHVKAFGVDTETPWSDVGTFVTMAEPVIPPEPTPPVVIPPVEEITPGWLWAIIGIGAALVIAVIVLIVTTRRVP